VPTTSSVSPTSNPYINGVLSGIKWGVNSLTYSFPTDPSFYGAYYGSGETTMGFEAFTVTQQNATRAILQQYSSYINVTFTEVTETATAHGDLRFAESDQPSTAWAYYPSSMDLGGDAWFNNSKNWYDNPAQGNYAYYTIMHEIGHTLGLKHPHAASGSFGTMPLDRDSVEYSVMSYRSYIGAGTSGLTVGSTSYPQTLMMYDIVALQEMYGANFSTNGGNTTYKWDPNTGRMYVNDVQATSPNGNKIFLTVWDGGGHDTYDFSNYTTNLDVNLNPGGWSIVSTTQLADLGSGKKAAGNIANALQYQGNTASLIEDAIGGSGNDKIVGNAANNKITGGAGSDNLDGGLGEDTACYAGTFADYSIVYNLDNSWTITDARLWCPDGVDTLWNFEWLQFYDVTVRLDSSLFEPTISAPAIAALLNDSEIGNDRITNNAALLLSGTAAADSTVKIYAGVLLLATAIADSNGHWSVTTSSLADGLYQLTATATDESGTTSSHSSQFTVVVDTSAPQVPQIMSFSPDTNTAGDRLTNSNSITLAGTAEANSQVHIYDGQTLLGVTTADQNGQWIFDTSGNAAAFAMGCGCAECAAARAEGDALAVLSDGEHVFTALSKDAAGNSSGVVGGAAGDGRYGGSWQHPVITGFSPDSECRPVTGSPRPAS
jgi:serralysin